MGGMLVSGGLGGAVAATRLPVIIAGAGPAGAATAIGLKRAGELVHVFEARGPIATRARNIFLRPQAREILHDLLGRDPGRDTTIMAIENGLRTTAKGSGVHIDYDHRILDVIERGDHVEVLVQRAGSNDAQTFLARMFVDASGGRLAATNVDDLQRVATGPSHVYVTAQYSTPPPFGKVFGVYDRSSREGLILYPIADGSGFVSYLDLPPGRALVDEAGLLARYDTLAGQLHLGTPISPPQAFDSQQHLTRAASRGHTIKIGDSGGNAEPYTGAGVAAALVDARSATRALSRRGEPLKLARAAAEDVLAGHRSLGFQGRMLLRTRNLGMPFLLPDARLDAGLRFSDLKESRGLDFLTRFFTSRRIPEAH